MTSKSSQSAKFIDLHGHHPLGQTQQNEVVAIYSFSPQINDLPSPGQWFCAGVHPWKLNHFNEDFELVKKLANQDNCLMIGEAGLDRSIDTELGKQEEIFCQHIELAIAMDKPLIIHNVRSLNDVLRLHKKYKKHTSWVLHDFNGSMQEMQSCHERKIYTSLGPRFFESSTAKIAQTILNNSIELEYIFFETDDRADICISAIYEKFAEIQKIDLNELKEQICNNFKALLGKNLMMP